MLLCAGAAASICCSQKPGGESGTSTDRQPVSAPSLGAVLRGDEGEREILKFFLAGSLSKLTRYVRYSTKVFKMVEKTKRCREQALPPLPGIPTFGRLG